jgi:hypothetical protein
VFLGTSDIPGVSKLSFNLSVNFYCVINKLIILLPGPD